MTQLAFANKNRCDTVSLHTVAPMPTIVDILDPHSFEKTGTTKPIYDAWAAGDWIGSFNLWVVQMREGVPSILYQQRSFRALWAPGLLDVTAGGHYDVGEQAPDGLREVREEIGRTYDFADLTYLGRKLYRRDEGRRHLRYAVDVFIIRDDAPLESFRLERSELEGLYVCPIEDLLRVHADAQESFVAQGISFREGGIAPATLQVDKNSFPFNEDAYHAKMAVFAQRFLQGERTLEY